MNATELIKRVYREQRDWRRASQYVNSGPEITWTLRGLNIARRIIDELIEEERVRQEIRNPRLSRWISANLLGAVNQALTYLKRCDKGKAIAVLEKARDAAQASKAKVPARNGPFLTAR